MPVITGTYSNNESLVYKFLTDSLSLNTAAACGIMANIYQESRFNHLAGGDSGTSFGLCQWHASRYTSLKSYCDSIGKSYKSVDGQMQYLRYEFTRSYSSVYSALKNVPNTKTGAYDAAKIFCLRFEIPANKEARAEERGVIAKDQYWSAYSQVTPSPVVYATDIGKTIVQVARAQVNKPYSEGSTGPNSYGPSGLVYYCYNQAGYTMAYKTVKDLYAAYKDTAKSVKTADISAGDLLFYVGVVSHVAIATGSGGKIHANRVEGKVVEDSIIGNVTYILRLVSDTETSKSIPTTTPSEPDPIEITDTDYTSLTLMDNYSDKIAGNLSRVQSSGYDYGYLIDMTHGGEFKFYIPEFTESAGANWEDIDIMGRSVTVKAYKSTSSRSISVDLELYAGVGLYNDISNTDIVGKLHEDLNFVKSLEYPDYTNPIVRPPSTVQLVLGSSVSIRGVVSDVSVEHMKPLDNENRSMYAKLSFTVTQTEDSPPDYTDIRNSQSSIASTSNVSSIS